MSKCIVCECASILYYQPPQERPPVVCPNCGRDTRRYPSMKVEDPRVNRLVAEYRSRFMQDEKTDSEETAGVEGTAYQNAATGSAATGNAVAAGSAAQPSVSEPVRSEKKAKIYCLVPADRSYRIEIPATGGVIGRTAIGAEELAHNGKISREHVRVMPAKRVEGIMVEDISANGTFLNGNRLIAHKQEFAVVGSEIKLFNEAFTLEVYDEQ